MDDKRLTKLAKSFRDHFKWMKTVKHNSPEGVRQFVNILLGEIRAAYPEETLEWVIIAADANRSAGIREGRERRGG